jgi:hypothetical protein
LGLWKEGILCYYKTGKYQGGKKKIGRYREYSIEFWEVIDDMNYWNPLKKEIIDREEQIKKLYNVYVYRVLPYLPPSRDRTEFMNK